MINFLPVWNVIDIHPSFHDVESVTAIEMVGRIYGKMNELVEDYNSFSKTVNLKVEEFLNSSEKDFELFRVGLRQEFQDFINIIELKLKNQDLLFEGFKKTIQVLSDDLNEMITQRLNDQDAIIQDTHDYFVTNITEKLNEEIQKKIDEGGLNIAMSYNEETEALSLIVE